MEANYTLSPLSSFFFPAYFITAAGKETKADLLNLFVPPLQILSRKAAEGILVTRENTSASDLQWVQKDSSHADTGTMKPDNLDYVAELETVSAFSCCEQSALLLSGSSVSICQPVGRALPLV